MTTARSTHARLVAVLATVATVLASRPGPPRRTRTARTTPRTPDPSAGSASSTYFDGAYGDGNDLYDVVLPQGGFSSSAFRWSYTEGFYIGPNYCAQLWDRYNASDGWSRSRGDITGPAQVYVSRYYYWKVVPYRC